MVLEQIIKMVAEQFMIDENEITADTSFVDDLGAGGDVLSARHAGR